MSQERQDVVGNRVFTKPGAVAGNITSSPDIHDTLERIQRVTDKVRVVHGSNEQYFDNLAGKNVGSIRKSLREVFNIPGDATSTVDGKEVGDDFILNDNMTLEFYKESGCKGASLYVIISYVD
jgi:hypothetical protein